MSESIDSLKGVGKVTLERLHSLGIYTFETLAVTPVHEIKSRTEIKKELITRIVNDER